MNVAAGFAGVINFPSHGIIDGRWRRSLELTGFGYDKEVEMIAEAHRQGLFTRAYVFTPEEAEAMTDAGVDVVVAHMGLTIGGLIGAPSEFAMTLDAAAARTEGIAAAARQRRGDVIVVCHGGPIATAADFAKALATTTIEGFIGTSSIERLPVGGALRDTVVEPPSLNSSPAATSTCTTTTSR